MAPLRLITIPISHYGERARWALDHAGLDYVEEHHLQFFSWGHALRRGGRKTLPVVLTPEGPLADSAEALRYASARASAPLYPEDPRARAEVEAYERPLADRYGVETRRVAYQWFFRALDVCLPYNAGAAPGYEVRAMDLLRGAVKGFAGRYLDLSPGAVSRGRGEVQRTLDAVAERLSDGRRYLFGERLTAADLTFAAMSAPALLPPSYGVPLPSPEALPGDVRRAVAEARAHPAGAFALRLFAARPAPRGRLTRPLRVPSTTR
ncbi:MAG: glutathione S-transferase [Deltaproteobacteria bacterium]|nr:glutathione S-transferase [Deltaproteobacteria bacterium]